MKKKLMKIILLLLLICIIVILLKGCSTKLVVTSYTYENAKIPSSFDGYRIVQISDLHCKEFGEGNSDLINTVKNLTPDLIVLTGDLVDDDHTDLTPVEEFLNGIQSIAPVYSVSGNHEYDSPLLYSEVLSMYQTYNIVNLDAASAIITKGSDSINLQGLGGNETIINCSYLLPVADTSKFNILLYHFTNHFDYLGPFKYDLVLSGHTHGGIVKLPGIGGILGNDNTLFPKYDSGMYVNEQNPSVTLISSSGLGDATIPRFNNNPEVVLITLKSTT